MFFSRWLDVGSFRGAFVESFLSFVEGGVCRGGRGSFFVLRGDVIGVLGFIGGIGGGFGLWIF